MECEAGYRVEAVRSGDWWAITVPALSGVFSQAKRLDQVESTAREAIAMMLDVDQSEVGPIEVDVTPPDGVVELLEALRQSTARAEEAAQEANRTRRQAAKVLREEGLAIRDVGKLLGVSHQRISQILSPDRVKRHSVG
jgi:predicted RNase H-like HicB family nuclease